MFYQLKILSTETCLSDDKLIGKALLSQIHELYNAVLRLAPSFSGTS